MCCTDSVAYFEFEVLQDFEERDMWSMSDGTIPTMTPRSGDGSELINFENSLETMENNFEQKFEEWLKVGFLQKA